MAAARAPVSLTPEEGKSPKRRMTQDPAPVKPRTDVTVPVVVVVQIIYMAYGTFCESQAVH